MTRTRKPEYINEYGSNSEYGSSTRLCTQISEYGMATRTRLCTQISENLAQYRYLSALEFLELLIFSSLKYPV